MKILYSLIFSLAIILHSPAAVGDVLTLLSKYDLSGTFSDSLGNGTDLVAIGSGTLTANGFAFGDSDGLQLETTLTSSDYLIEFDATFTELDGWDKLLDFEDRLLDTGLYVGPLDSNLLNLYSYNQVSVSSILLNTPYTIGLQRLDGVATVLIDGNTEFAVNDSFDFAISSVDRLHFFLDDSDVPGEGIAGTVTGIRLYEFSAVPEPSALGLTTVALASGFIGRRRRS